MVTDAECWQRRTSWGSTPAAVHSILCLMVLTDVSQRAFTGAVSHAVREAAAFSVMLGRRAHRRCLAQLPRPDPAPTRSPASRTPAPRRRAYTLLATFMLTAVSALWRPA